MGLRISTKLFVISIGTAASVRITRNVSEHDAVTIMGHENQDATKNGIDENFSIEKQLSKRHKRQSEYNAMALLEEFDPNNPPVTPEDHQKQYDKMEENDEAYYGIPYDLGSIMQYAPSNENATVIAKDKNYSRTMGSPFVSFTDKLLVNKHYNCSEFCREETAVQCANNGFLDPKDCNTCVCPKGFGGKSCEKRPDGCGQDVEARTEWQTINLTIYNRDNNGEYMECTVWILADPGKKIEVQIVGVSTGLDSTGCGKAGVEIKMKNDTRLTGYRFCSDEDNGISLKSNSNLVPVIMYSKVATPLDVILNYHSVSST
ncbi:hypothetical protein Y032_0003g1393 [Ancylostoma ceylanicum]|uniref:Peptidase M12A domain-containing protein n=1 Tax=Ancylostoma ceylanicum TaxID=53326 RepID=A0A016VYL4_9BILA|nr:hypothetical protein Y032_0003g1393 [Ancylostoma ceylanicum]